MKKLLMGSICLFLFAASILMIQVSCSKTTAQNNSATVTQVGKIIFVKDRQIRTANYDGTAETLIPVTLPPGRQFSFGSFPQVGLAVSPDGQKVFFTAQDVSVAAPFPTEMYSVNIDGSGLTLIYGNGPALGLSPMIAF